MPAQYRLIAFLIALMAIFLFWPKKVLATPPILNSYPDIITVDEEYSVEATMSGLSKNTIYRLRLVLAKPGTWQYFGSTWNESDWYNGTPSPINYANFLTVTTNNDGTWFGEVRGLIESSDPNYGDGPGSYDLKLGRYTEAGSTATWSEPKTVTLEDLTPTPEPTPTEESEEEPTPEESPSPSPTSSPKPIKITGATLSGKVLSEEESSPAGYFPWEATEEGKGQEATSSSRTRFIPKLFLVSGLVFLFVSGGYLWYNQRKQL